MFTSPRFAPTTPNRCLLIGLAMFAGFSAPSANFNVWAQESPEVASANIAVRSPSLVFTIDPSSLTAVTWQNQLTGTSLSFASGCELEVEIGDKPEQAQRVSWDLAGPITSSANADQAVLRFKAQDGSLEATCTYRVDSKRAVLRKFVELTNTGREPLRVLNIVLGRYPVTAKAEGGERGFPLYLDDQFFVSLAHPSGFARMENGEVVLRQYPGLQLAPGQKLSCMEVVYGVAKPGEIRASFVSYVRSRMRRVVRGHDKPYAVLESFGGQPSGDFWTTEKYLLEHLAKVAQGQREGGPRFDFYAMEFWHDTAGDLTKFNPKNFPSGSFQEVGDAILGLEMRPGLWIDSGGLPSWTICDNPAVRGCFTQGDGRGEICRASEPINSMYRKAFVEQVRKNKVGILKFDNLGPSCQPPCCNNPAHDHLPGPLYSVEAIHNAVIGFLCEMDASCPDVFLALYWGYRSPWWLQYSDTYFECGAQIEAASPAEFPAPHARDSVTQRLDQAQWLIRDTPWLGKDSLGVWLSDWPWNSCIGNGRWQEGLIMDLCRGSLMAQIWTDTNWLTPSERRQLADFIALLKNNADCFDNSRFILGNPWKSEPYGYSCTNGQKAFVAIHNASLQDNLVTLQLGPPWGLPDKGRWDVYRWYPQPAKLLDHGQPLGREAQLILRPYEVTLLEVTPVGESASLGRTFPESALPAEFAEPTRTLDPAISVVADLATSRWQLLRPVTAAARKAELAILEDHSIRASGENIDGEVYTVTTATDARAVTAVMIEALPDSSLPGQGPGRAVNGNFALNDFHLLAAPQGQPDQAVEVKIRAAHADFSQTGHGGWVVASAIDASATTGWSIFPETGSAHAAIFELDRPIDFADGTVLTWQLSQGERGHSFGRFRVSITDDTTVKLPAAYRSTLTVVETTVPATQTGGRLLFIGVKGLTPQAAVAGQKVSIESVWSERAYWPCSWNAWRCAIDPAAVPRPIRVTWEGRQADAASNFSVHFLPQ
ncbi:MAG: hypothetical protein ACYC3X_05815 [Pirellulaceae bacterium]